MNKVLHVLVYVFLALAGAALFFEMQLNDKRSLLTDRNRLQEDYYVRLARTIEKAEPGKDAVFEIKKDNSPVEARIVDSPDMENLLEEYPAQLEQTGLDTYNWDNAREQLRQIYATDGEGNPIMDGNQPLMRGPGTEDALLSALLESAKNQQSRLNTTRSQLTKLRGKLEAIVVEFNKLKQDARQDKVTIEEMKGKMTKLDEEKATAEAKATQVKAKMDELNGEIASLKDEVSTAKDETAAKEEELSKITKLNDQLKKLLQESIQTSQAAATKVGSGVAAITALTSGAKGKIIEADNESMFALIEFTPEALKELKGNDLSRPLPAIEMGVKRPGFNGEAGEFVGRVRLRQEVKGKPFVICDILGAWEQDKLVANDVVFAD